ncbi:MAG: type I-E CRISPR-associated protein Cse1/CasA [Pseudanabaenaceae cyanobacterium bins.68]|nr:type I-E CRISPR-associated protein Cse1/CasA [Pseudanabaenaceae cyanobacterium bins.68]
MSFNLTIEKWIPVVSMDWQRQEVSLIELFQTWEQWREIQAENPPTTLAIYRFLLAILHRVYQGPTDVDHWLEIRENNGKKAIAYLKKYADCFDLLHPQKPFMQDPSLQRGVEDKKSPHAFLAAEMQGGNTGTVFCHDHLWSGSSLSISEAARLIVKMQVFDVYGRKTGVTERVGGIPTVGVAITLIQGSNLCQTLMLNMIRYDPDADEPSPVKGEDLPTWERINKNPQICIPSGYIHYLTYRWRRTKIFLDRDRVVQVAVQPGDRLCEKESGKSPSVDEKKWECAIAYKEMSTKKKDEMITVALKIDLNRSLWRDSTALFQSEGLSCPPRIVNWLATLKSELEHTENSIPKILGLQIFGLAVDDAKPLSGVYEQLNVPTIYLTERKLWEALKIAIAFAESHRQIFRSFKGSPYFTLAESLKGSAEVLSNSLDGESRYWLSLDRLFPIFLDELAEDDSTGIDGIKRYGQIKLPEWKQQVQDAAKTAFTDSIGAIRDRCARALGLRSLSFWLARLRDEESEVQATKKTSSTTKNKGGKK